MSRACSTAVGRAASTACLGAMGEVKRNPIIATKEECEAAKIDPAWRDACAHFLIPLNECRKKNFYLPWKCEHERHIYEKCQYLDYKNRVAIREQEKARGL